MICAAAVLMPGRWVCLCVCWEVIKCVEGIIQVVVVVVVGIKWWCGGVIPFPGGHWAIRVQYAKVWGLVAGHKNGSTHAPTLFASPGRRTTEGLTEKYLSRDKETISEGALFARALSGDPQCPLLGGSNGQPPASPIPMQWKTDGR